MPTSASLVSLIVGKYPRALQFVLSLAGVLALLALLIKWLVKKEFVVADEIGFLVIFVLSIVNFVLVTVFSVVLNKLEDKTEKTINAAKEI